MKFKKLPIYAIAIALFATSCGSLKFGSKKFECRNDLTKATAARTTTVKDATVSQAAVVPSSQIENAIQAANSTTTIEKNVASKNTAKQVVASATKTNSFKTNIIHKIAETRAEKLVNKMVQKYVPTTKKSPLNQTTKKDDALVLLYILAILIPPVAVGLATNWDMMPIIYNLLWCLLCGLPGIIHAFIVIARERG